MNWLLNNTPKQPTLSLRILVLGPLNSGKSSLITHISGQSKPDNQYLLGLTIAKQNNFYLEFIEISSRLSTSTTCSLFTQFDGLILVLDCQDSTSITRITDLMIPLRRYITHQPITLALMKSDLGMVNDLELQRFIHSFGDMGVIRGPHTAEGSLDLEEWRGFMERVYKEKVDGSRDRVTVFLD
jgi:hypothetical protein